MTESGLDRNKLAAQEYKKEVLSSGVKRLVTLILPELEGVTLDNINEKVSKTTTGRLIEISVLTERIIQRELRQIDILEGSEPEFKSKYDNTFFGRLGNGLDEGERRRLGELELERATLLGPNPDSRIVDKNSYYEIIKIVSEIPADKSWELMNELQIEVLNQVKFELSNKSNFEPDVEI